MLASYICNLKYIWPCNCFYLQVVTLHPQFEIWIGKRGPVYPRMKVSGGILPRFEQSSTLYLHKSPWWHLTRLKGPFCDRKYIWLARSHPIFPSPGITHGDFGKDYLGNGKIVFPCREWVHHTDRLSFFSFVKCSHLFSRSVLHRAVLHSQSSSHGEFLILWRMWRITTFPSHHRAHPCVQRACELAGLCSRRTSHCNSCTLRATALHFNWVPASLLLSAPQCHPTQQGSMGARTPSFHFWWVAHEKYYC